MSYVATRNLKVPGKDGTLMHLNKGDEVVDFESWNEVAKRANLNLGWVEKVDSSSAQPKKTEANKKKTKASK